MSQEDVRSDIFAIMILGVVSLTILVMMIISSELGIICLNIALHSPEVPIAARLIIGACGIALLALSWYIAINTIAIAIALLLKSISMNALLVFKAQLDKIKLGLRPAQQFMQVMVTEHNS